MMQTMMSITKHATASHEGSKAVGLKVIAGADPSKNWVARTVSAET